MAEWTRTDQTYAQRIAHLRKRRRPERLGSAQATGRRETVFDDGAEDAAYRQPAATGSSPTWTAALLDQITDQHDQEFAINVDF